MRHRVGRSTIRWAVPAVVAVVATGAVLAPSMADATPTLPPRTAHELLAATASASTQAFSGTVQQTARLGLPDLPTTTAGPHPPTSWASLVTGTHTLRVWYGGPDRQRVNLVEDLSETDVIRSGRTLWTWNSDSRAATRLMLPDHVTATPGLPSGGAPSAGTGASTGPTTPAQAAAMALAAIDPSTTVSVDGTASVAGRSAYELVLAPRDSRSLVRQVRLAIDATTSTPLRVEVFGTASQPAFETAFTSITFATPPAGIFAFTPPPGATVKVVPLPTSASTKPHPTPAPRGSTTDRSAVIGSGWTSVLELRGSGLTGDTNGGDTNGMMSSPQLLTLLRAARPVSGSFGTGRSLQTALVSALLLDDGRVFVGAVPVTMLEQAATSASALPAAAPTLHPVPSSPGPSSTPSR